MLNSNSRKYGFSALNQAVLDLKCAHLCALLQILYCLIQFQNLFVGIYEHTYIKNNCAKLTCLGVLRDFVAIEHS